MPSRSLADSTFALLTGRMTKANDQAQVDAVSLRVHELQELNADQLDSRTLVRDILDGGMAGLRAIIGRDFKSADPRIPAANLMLSGMTRLAQKTGRVPDGRVDPPVDNDSDNQRRRAVKKARIVAGLDKAAKLHLQGPQQARWCPGYGFTPWVVEHRRAPDGSPYPHASLRDPFTAYPSQWSIDQQPRDIAFLHVMGLRELVDRFPAHSESLRALAAGRGVQANVVGTASSRSFQAIGWESQSGGGIEVWEYLNEDGTWWILPEKRLLLSFTPNPLDRPAFHVVKRFSFNKLIGQYDHVIGLMAGIARLNVLSIIAAEDAVFAEANIAGELVSGKYRRGRNAVNFFTPGSKLIERQSRIPPEVFRQAEVMERQLRSTAGYPVTDDTESPASWATGRGLEELTTAIGLEIGEYFTVYQDGFEEIDSIRLEWDERLYGGRTKTITGKLAGTAFTDRYTPRTAIGGSWITRRDYGLLASLDEPTKVVALLNFLQNDVLDVDTVREHIPGIGDITRVAERVQQSKLMEVAMSFLLARAEGGDMASMDAVIQLMRDGDVKEILRDVFLPEEQEVQQQAAQLALPQGAGGAPPDIATALARMTQAGPTLGTQTVARGG